jgi:O-antigen/teichoic acid export membrane protein
MAAGLLVFGISGYVFVALTGRTLDKSEANLAIAFYFLVNVVGPGVFSALEQVASRTASRSLAAELPLGPGVVRGRRAGLGLAGAVVAILLLLSPILVGATLHGDWVVFAEVLVTPVVAGTMHFIRGLLAGMRRFGGYAGTLAVEGSTRVLFCGVLAVGGAGGAWLYGLAYLASTLVAVLAGLVWLRARSGVNVADRTVAANDHAPLARSLVTLAFATLFAQFLPNIAPLVVASRLPGDSAIALAFGQAAVIARIPLLLFFPIQTMLLPGMTAAVTRGELHVVARRIRLSLTVITALGVLGSVIFVVLGPWVLRTFLSTTVRLDTPIMWLLAVSTVVLVAAFAVQPALVALGREHAVTLGWAIGSAATLAIAVLPRDPATMAALAQVVGPALTMVIVLLGLRTALRPTEDLPTCVP